MVSREAEIEINPRVYKEYEQMPGMMEMSLRKYLSQLYIEYPEYVRLNVNGSPVDLRNPYSLLKKNFP